MYKTLVALSLLLAVPIAGAFENFDECGELEEALAKNKVRLSLDTPFEQKKLGHGLRVTFGNEADEEWIYPQISSCTFRQAAHQHLPLTML